MGQQPTSIIREAKVVRLAQNNNTIPSNLHVIEPTNDRMVQDPSSPRLKELAATWNRLPLWLRLCASDITVAIIDKEENWNKVAKHTTHGFAYATGEMAVVRYAGDHSHSVHLLGEEVIHALEGRIAQSNKKKPLRYTLGYAWQDAMKADMERISADPQASLSYLAAYEKQPKSNHVQNLWNAYRRGEGEGCEATKYAIKTHGEACVEALPDIFRLLHETTKGRIAKPDEQEKYRHLKALSESAEGKFTRVLLSGMAEIYESAPRSGAYADGHVHQMLPNLYKLYVGPTRGNILIQDILSGEVKEVPRMVESHLTDTRYVQVESFRQVCERYFAKKMRLPVSKVKFDLRSAASQESVLPRTMDALADPKTQCLGL